MKINDSILSKMITNIYKWSMDTNILLNLKTTFPGQFNIIMIESFYFKLEINS